MRRGYLIFETGKERRRRVLIENGLTIGRNEDCGLVIDDGAASRHHAEIRVSGDAFTLKDLGSTNGTLVDGTRVSEFQLAHGARIRIGETVLRFEIEDARNGAESPVSFLGTILDGDSELTVEPTGVKAETLFQAVYTVTNAVASNFEPCSLVDRILETTIRAIRAQRGAIFFAGLAEGGLSPCPICKRVHVIRDGVLERADIGAIRISETVARRVLSGGESVLFQDTEQADDELHAAQSIVSLNLRSIICAPLRAKSGILGILYIDTDRASHAYTKEDMLLSSAVANSAGLAIENANMHQQMLEKQRIEQEIAHAWTIQQGFLIKEWPSGERGFEVYGETRPAKTVGGDFYDFVEPDGEHIGILIGDVSGKGVPAALSMAQLLAQFRLCARDRTSPAAVLGMLNADLVTRSQRGMFCTMCYILLELKTGRLICANAGHHPPIHIQKGGIGYFGEASGPPAGILPEVAWQDTQWQMGPGDTVFLYTDGVVEARRSAAKGDTKTHRAGPEDYGIEGLTRIAGRLHGRTSRETVQIINEDVLAFCAPDAPHDDCTLIAVRYLGNTK